MIEFDVETTGLQYYAGDRPFLGQTLDFGSPILYDLPENREAFEAHFELHDGYRAWNTKFDLHMMRAAGYRLPPEEAWHDGMVVAHLLDANHSVALQAVADRLLPEAGRDTEARLRAWLEVETKRRRAESKAAGTEFERPNYSHVPDDIIRPYAEHDVVIQRQVMDLLMPALEATPELAELYELERKVLGALFWMEDRGMPFDRRALVGLEADLLPQLDELEDRCRRIADFKNFNPRSPKQIGEALERLGADTSFMARTDAGALVTDEENLEACDHPLADAVLAYRGQQKIWSMVHRMLHGKAEDKFHPKPFLTDEDRIHANVRQVGAKHGRMSCAEPNLQQIPRDDLRLRYAVAAPPGFKLVCVDLDSIEWRLLGAFTGPGHVLDGIKRGTDPHVFTAQGVGLHGRTRSSGAVEDERAQGKRMNYAVGMYGGGVRAMRKWFGIPQGEAQAIKRRFKDLYPEVAALEERIEYTLYDQGYIKSPWGRRFRVEKHAGRESYKFLNYLISGTAADLFKVATAEVHRQGVPLIGVVHDELMALVPEADAAEAGDVMVRALTDHPRITERVPLEAEAKIVDRWSQAKNPDYTPDYAKES